jgi:hypothetical protein
MEGHEPDNLRELLGRFFDAGQVKDCLDDFQEAERFFREHPAPEPDEMLITNIKAEIAMRLSAVRVKTFRRRLWEMAGVAAAVAVLALVGVQLSNKPSRQTGYYASLLPTAIWESNNITTDDADLALFTTQIEQIKDEMQGLESGQVTGDNDNSVAELEMELIQISGDFWKG